MSEFTKSVEHYCEGYHVAVGASASCAECRQDYGIDDDVTQDEAQEQMIDEGAFSCAQCDSCGSILGGDRYAAHGIPQDYKAGGDTYHLSICVDCLMFHANGDEPESWQRVPD